MNQRHEFERAIEVLNAATAPGVENFQFVTSFLSSYINNNLKLWSVTAPLIDSYGGVVGDNETAVSIHASQERAEEAAYARNLEMLTERVQNDGLLELKSGKVRRNVGDFLLGGDLDPDLLTIVINKISGDDKTAHNILVNTLHKPSTTADEIRKAVVNAIAILIFNGPNNDWFPMHSVSEMYTT